MDPLVLLSIQRAGLRLAALCYVSGQTGRWFGPVAWHHYQAARVAALGVK